MDEYHFGDDALCNCGHTGLKHKSAEGFELPSVGNNADPRACLGEPTAVEKRTFPGLKYCRCSYFTDRPSN